MRFVDGQAAILAAQRAAFGQERSGIRAAAYAGTHSPAHRVFGAGGITIFFRGIGGHARAQGDEAAVVIDARTAGLA